MQVSRINKIYDFQYELSLSVWCDAARSCASRNWPGGWGGLLELRVSGWYNVYIFTPAQCLYFYPCHEMSGVKAVPNCTHSSRDRKKWSVHFIAKYIAPTSFFCHEMSGVKAAPICSPLPRGRKKWSFHFTVDQEERAKFFSSNVFIP